MKPLEVDLSGRVALVTGANSGMGEATARELARMGADVILACRSRRRGELARKEIADSCGAATATVMEIDLSSPASVRAFATAFHERFAKLDVLVDNAAASLPAREVTPEGFERHWATNVLGPHLLTTLLLPALGASGHGRIVTVSTRAAGGLDLSDTQYERRRYRGSPPTARPSRPAGCSHGRWPTRSRTSRSRSTRSIPATCSRPSPRNVTGPLKALVALTGFAAQTPVDGADTAIWPQPAPSWRASRANSGPSAARSDAGSATRPRSRALRHRRAAAGRPRAVRALGAKPPQGRIRWLSPNSCHR